MNHVTVLRITLLQNARIVTVFVIVIVCYRYTVNSTFSLNYKMQP
jgi:hypothetical protein